MRTTTWNGIGTTVKTDNIQTALENANLDYEVITRPIYTEIGDSKILVPGKVATVNKDTNEVFGVVSSKYQVCQNADAFDFVNNTITIKHKVIETIVDEKRTILLKDKTKNSSSYRSLPLVPEIKEKLLEHKKKIEANRKLCGNSYNKEYKDYICVDATGKIYTKWRH